MTLADRYKLIRAAVTGDRRVTLGYHAVQDKGRRQAPISTVRSEDAQLSAWEKSKLDMTTQDLPRNFELAAWALRLHVAYVSRLMPHVQTADPEINKLVARLLARESRKERFDVAARHSRDRAMALFELANVYFGDAAFLKLADGRVQGIPGSRIAKPSGVQPASAGKDRWARLTERGLILDPATGAMSEACICRWKTGGNSLEFDHFEPAGNLIFNGYFSDFDQSRGTSPMASCVNRCKDVMDALEYTTLKIKLHSLLGVAFSSDASAAMLDTTLAGDESTTTERPKYNVELSRGLMVLNMRPGDKADMLESRTPTPEFVDYMSLSVRIALLAFDIPYTFLDSKASSFSARIADANQYEFIAAEKRAKNAEVCAEWSAWKLAMLATQEPLASALAAAGMSPEELIDSVEWVGAETPWVDKLKQLQGDQLAISMGVDSIPRVCRRRNVDWKTIAEENGEAVRYSRETGAPLMVGQPGQASAGDVNGQNDDDQP